MDWKDLEKMTVLKLREEALKFPQIEGVHGKNKEQLMLEIAKALGIEKPHGSRISFFSGRNTTFLTATLSSR